MLVVLLVLSLSLGVGLSACEFPFPPSPTPTQPPASPPPTETPGSGNNPGSGTPTPPPPTEEPLHCSGELTKRGNKTAYLTFDDGGSRVIEVADALKRQNIRATFFINQMSLDTAQKIKDNGHVIGLHGYTHPVPNDGSIHWWWHPNFRVSENITKQVNELAPVLGNNILLRAPGGEFVRIDVFHHSEKWKPYKDAYFYGWDVHVPISDAPSKPVNEPAGLGSALDAKGSPDGAIILLHSNHDTTVTAVIDGTIRSILECRGYSKFEVLPRLGDAKGYQPKPIGTALGWAAETSSWTHYEEDGKDVRLP
jgi:peptidoglycan/xylan/chitin deacetylase (PgdA/CDA1 family)